MLLKAIQLWDPTSQSMCSKSLLVTQQGTIIYEPTNEEIPDDVDVYDFKAEASFLPGLLDSHIHGHGGFDFSQIHNHDDALKTILAAIGKTGISYIMPTLVSLAIPTLTNILQVLDKYVAAQSTLGAPGLAQIVGVHLEGPYISEPCKGAHDKNVLQDTISLEIFKNIIKHAPHIKEWKITLSPDIHGAIEFIKDLNKLQQEGIFVKVFIGHTNPKPEYITSAIAAGVAGITHFGNACSEKCSRISTPLHGDEFSSELVKWILNHPDDCPAGVELIVDGVHLSSHFVSYVQTKLKDKIALVSDSLGPSGLADGKYKLGTVDILKEGKSFYIDEETNSKERKLAGSGASLADCIQIYWQWTKGQGIYKAAIENPRLSALSKTALESLADTQNAVIFDQQGNLVMSLCQGKINLHNPQMLCEYKVESNNKKRFRC